MDAGLNLFHAPLQLGTGEIAIPVIDCLELAAVDGDQGLGEQTELLAQHHELTADATDRGAVVLPEVGNGLEVRHQATGQPHQFNVALRFPFQASARLNPIEVAVDV